MERCLAKSKWTKPTLVAARATRRASAPASRDAVQRRTRTRRPPVLGAVGRGGRVRAVVAQASIANIDAALVSRILPASTVFTDESRLYDKLGMKGYTHRRIKHRERIYVSGDVHTNTIEGFWSLTKNGIRGVYHAVSAKHLQGYLNEYAWRYNHRADERAQFETLLLRAARR